MSSSNIDPKLVEEAQAHARDLLALFKEWVPKRKKTVRELRDIASELENVAANVNFVRFTGTTAAVAGGVATVAGIGATFLTGGLAAPLIGIGIASSVGGTVARSTADIIGQAASKGKMEKAQKKMDKEAKLSSKIEQKKKELDKAVDRLSASLRLDRDQVLGILFLTMVNYTRGALSSISTATGALLLFTAAYSTAVIISRVTLESVGKGMAKTAVSISLQGVTKIVGSVLKGFAIGAAGFVLVWDVYQLVRTTLDIVEGSKSAAADALRKVATELEKQMKEIEDWLIGLEKQAKDYEQAINEKFRKLLKRVSSAGSATEAQKQEVWQYVQHYADPAWLQAFGQDLPYDEFTFHLARVIDILYRQVKDYQEREKRKDVTITIIGHGGINPFRKVSSFFYYLNPVLKSVTLYEPWGCAVDAMVVYGITTNTISIGSVQYSGEVRPGTPTDWKILPRSFRRIPNTTLTPVRPDDGAYKDLMAIFAFLQGVSDGLVIPYFIGSDNDLFPFPEIPLWVLCNALALIGRMKEDDFVKIRVAACLSVHDPSSVSGHVPCSQYYTVDGSVSPPIFMTSDLGLSTRQLQELKQRLQRLNQFL